MGRALAVYHGAFGRATVYHLDRTMATHAHREGHLTFHLSGRTSAMTIDGEQVTISRGDGGAVNPWQPHNFEPGDRHRGSVFLVLYISPIWYLDFGQSGLGGFRFGRSEIEVTPMIRRLVDQVGDLLLRHEFSDRLSGFLYELTREAYDQTWRNAAVRGGDIGASPTFCDHRVRKSINILMNGLGDDMDFTDVARRVGLSRPHFFKLFKRQTGLTPNIYANTLRMERAIDELTQGEKSITEISYDLRFSSQASFSRFFSLNVGISPSNYRQVVRCER